LSRAVELDPAWPNVRQWLAFRLAAEGRFDEALGHSRKAAELEPLSFLTSADLASILYFARRYDEAIADARRTLELDAQASQGHFLRGACLTAKGRYAEAVAELRRALPATPPPPAVAARLGFACARAGAPEEAVHWLQTLAADRTHQTEAAMVATGMGRKAEALAMLEQAVAAREGSTLFLKVEPLFDDLRKEARFAALLRALGL